MSSDKNNDPNVSPTEPDWDRERPRVFWSPSKKLLRAVRQYQTAKASGGFLGRLRSKFISVRYRFWSAVAQADVPLTARIGGGLKLPHPNGVVIHPASTIGPNCILFQQVTLGTSSPGSGAPEIGGGVEIGAGARVIGPVTIGNHAIIGANAVVLDDVPEAAIAVGIPARVIGKRW